MILKNYINVQKILTALLFVVLSLAGSQQAFAQPYCDVEQGSPGFASDLACQTAICDADAFCCDVEWDGICAGDAATEPACAGCLQPTTPPDNDDACDAEALTFGVPALIENTFATVQQYEASPLGGSGSSSCQSDDGWCSFETDADNTVWYSFVAPASGCISLLVEGPADLQMAVWSTPSCTNFFKYKLIAANDDQSGDFSPALSNISVTPGLTYLVQIDGFSGADANGDVVTVTDGAGPVPAPWSTTHIGTAVGDFSYVTCGDEYTASTNENSTPLKDVGGYILQTFCGDGYFQARVESVEGSGWAGIVLRESTAQGSKKVAMKTQLNNLIKRDQRKSTNGFSQSKLYPRPNGWNWLRIERVGNQFTGYISNNGQDWQKTFSTTFLMNGCLQVGMFVESININSVTTAVFSNPSTGLCPCESSFPLDYDGAYCGDPTGEPGFPDDPACEAAVCALDAFCCDVSWDGICAGIAESLTTQCAACLSAAPPAFCNEPQDGPGFPSDSDCEAIVCFFDSFCCTVTWDAICASAAESFLQCADCLNNAAPPGSIGLGTLQEEVDGNTPQNIGSIHRIGDLTVFPNPSNGIVNIQVEDFIGKPATIVIYNNIGQEVYRQEFDAIEASTIVADLTSAKITSGLYNLNFIHEGQRITKQVVITK